MPKLALETSSRPTARPSKTAWKERARTVKKSLTGLLLLARPGSRWEWERRLFS